MHVEAHAHLQFIAPETSWDAWRKDPRRLRVAEGYVITA